MVIFLSAEFFQHIEERGRRLPELRETDVVAQYVVRGAPGGDVHYYFRIVKGRLQEARLGDADDAGFTASMSHDDAVLIQQGKLTAPAALTSGRIQVTGDLGQLMAMMPLMQSSDYQALQMEMREITRY